MLERGAGSWDIEPYTQTYLGEPIGNPINASSNFPLYGLNNNVGLLTLPNAFYPAYALDIQNYSGLNQATFAQDMLHGNDEIAPQQANWLSCFYYGIGCEKTGEGFFPDLKANIESTLKNFGLLALAIVLVAFGLYLLGKSTDTGSAIINVAKKL